MKPADKLALSVVFALIFSCSSNDAISDGDKGNDINNYRTVAIGNQIWMAENMNYNVEGSKCYEDKPENCAKYGRLYDWETAVSVCPDGWHLPTKDEWDILTNYIETDKNCTSCDAKHLNSYGFAVIYSGYYENWWTASEFNVYEAYYRGICSCSERMGGEQSWNKAILFSVRCVKDLTNFSTLNIR